MPISLHNPCFDFLLKELEALKILGNNQDSKHVLEFCLFLISNAGLEFFFSSQTIECSFKLSALLQISQAHSVKPDYSSSELKCLRKKVCLTETFLVNSSTHTS